MSKGAEVATVERTELTLEQVEDVLLHGGDLAVVTPEDAQDDMVRRILTAGSVEEAFQSFTTTPATELDGVALEVHGVAWMRSAFPEGAKVYALLKCVIAEDGREEMVSMGGRTLMASFVYAQRQEAMPIRGTFRKRRSNSNTERSFWTFVLA